MAPSQFWSIHYRTLDAHQCLRVVEGVWRIERPYFFPTILCLYFYDIKNMESRILRRNNINRICSSQEYFCRLRLYRATDAIIYFSFAFYIPTFYFWRKIVETSFAFVEEKAFFKHKWVWTIGYQWWTLALDKLLFICFCSWFCPALIVFQRVEDTWPLVAGQLLAYSFLAFPLVLFCWTLQPSLRGGILWEWSRATGCIFWGR